MRNFQHPLNTTLSVEYSEQSRRPYGPIRMMGAVGYALMMSLVGVVSAQEHGVEKTFILYSGICLLNILLIFLLPPMKGHNRKSEGKKMSPAVLFKSKPILMLILFIFVIPSALQKPMYFRIPDAKVLRLIVWTVILMSKSNTSVPTS